MPHSQPTALQQTACKFHLDPQYHIFHWGSTILGDSTLCMHTYSVHNHGNRNCQLEVLMLMTCRSSSKLALVMACCLTALRHYLKQFWLDNRDIPLLSPETNYRRVLNVLLCITTMKIVLLKLLPHLPGANELISSDCLSFPLAILL